MSDDKDPRPQFFRDVHELAQMHGVITYVVVGVVQRESALAVASGAGSRLNDAAEIAPKVYQLMEKAFTHAMGSISEDGEPVAPKGTLVN